MRSIEFGLIQPVINAAICCSSWGNGVDSKKEVRCGCSLVVGVV